jgi:hypothetical protein
MRPKPRVIWFSCVSAVCFPGDAFAAYPQLHPDNYIIESAGLELAV